MTLMLIGNKSDLSTQREVSSEDASIYAEREQMVNVETSALNASNVNLAFESIIKGKFKSFRSICSFSFNVEIYAVDAR